MSRTEDPFVIFGCSMRGGTALTREPSPWSHCRGFSLSCRCAFIVPTASTVVRAVMAPKATAPPWCEYQVPLGISPDMEEETLYPALTFLEIKNFP